MGHLKKVALFIAGILKTIGYDIKATADFSRG